MAWVSKMRLKFGFRLISHVIVNEDKRISNLFLLPICGFRRASKALDVRLMVECVYFKLNLLEMNLIVVLKLHFCGA